MLPPSVAVDSSENVYVADSHNSAVKEIVALGVNILDHRSSLRRASNFRPL